MRWTLLLLLIACQPIAQPVIDSDTIECVVDRDGIVETISLSTDVVRVDVHTADAHSLYTTEFVYIWNKGEGTKLPRSDFVEAAGESGKTKPTTPDEVLSVAKEEGIKCEPKNLSSDFFTPPTNVNFVDLSEVLSETSDIKELTLL